MGRRRREKCEGGDWVRLVAILAIIALAARMGNANILWAILLVV